MGKGSRGNITGQNNFSKIKISFCIYTLCMFIKNNNVLILPKALISTNYKCLNFSYFTQKTSSANILC